MNTKKYLVYAGVTATILGGVASLVLAEDKMREERFNKAMMGEHEGPEMIVKIGPNGKTTLRGTVKTVGSGSLVVTSWGGDWVVNIPASANVMPTSDLTKFKAGDFVGVQGDVNKTMAWTVDARIVRDWSIKKAEQESKELMKKERRNNKQEIEDVIKNENPRNWQGIANNINTDAKSFTLTIEGTAYTVNLVADVKVVSKNFLTASFADVKDGDNVRVWGPVSGTTISAYVLRDISIGMESGR